MAMNQDDIDAVLASVQNHDSDDPIQECGATILEALRTDPANALSLADSKLRVFPFKDVRICWRRLYTDASIVLAVENLRRGIGGDLAKHWVKKGSSGDSGDFPVTEKLQGHDQLTELVDATGSNAHASDNKKRKAVGFDERTYAQGESLRRAASTSKTSTEPKLFPDDPAWVTESIRLLDMAILMTGAPLRTELIASLFLHIESLLLSSKSSTAPKRQKRSTSLSHLPKAFPMHASRAPDILFPIPRVSSMSITGFQSHISAMNSPTPLVITDAIQHWPALSDRPWHSPAYILQKTLGGRRLVPVELGRAYTDEGWGQKIVPFGEVLSMWIRDGTLESNGEEVAKGEASERKGKGDCSNDLAAERASSPESSSDHGQQQQQQRLAYLAQHDLFSQIPSLRADICVPDYCYTIPPRPMPAGDTVPAAAPDGGRPAPVPPPKHRETLADPLLNAWFGPAGTISPLHTDPHHNILCQVVGRKYVRLYAPSESAAIEPRGPDADGVDMSNTSGVPVDVVEMGGMAADVEEFGEGDEDEDEEEWRGEAREAGDEVQARWDRFERARYVETVLAEGECLYIPQGWWHYVRALTVSFSVSFWWN